MAPDSSQSFLADPEALSKLSVYLNAEGAEKLQVGDWLISAILAEFNHLRGMVRTRH